MTSANADTIAGMPEAFTACRWETIALASGDLLRISGNGRDRTGKHRVNNGSVHRVRGFDGKTGGVVLDNGWVLDRHFGKWAPGYVSTSFGGQGKTVDHVLLAVSAHSYAAGCVWLTQSKEVAVFLKTILDLFQSLFVICRQQKVPSHVACWNDEVVPQSTGCSMYAHGSGFRLYRRS